MRRDLFSFGKGGLAFLAVLALLSACSSKKGLESEPLEAMDAEGAPQFTEASIEFFGPEAKWAGPASLSFHLVAKSPAPEISFKTGAGLAFSRKLASIDAPAKKRSDANALTTETAQDLMKRLYVSARQTETKTQGCILPVHLRLVRSDGATLERDGCRGQQGWPSLASETADRLISAWVIGKKKPI